jgi:hypothetical protein
MLQQTGVGWLTAQTLIPTIAGLLGVAVGGWMQGHHQKKERENAFIKERLRDFYAPLLGMRSEIRAKSELRLKVSSITHAEWQAKFEGITDPEVKKAIDAQESPKYEKVFDYNDKQLREEIVPLYKKMLEWFTGASTDVVAGGLLVPNLVNGSHERQRVNHSPFDPTAIEVGDFAFSPDALEVPFQTIASASPTNPSYIDVSVVGESEFNAIGHRVSPSDLTPRCWLEGACNSIQSASMPGSNLITSPTRIAGTSRRRTQRWIVPSVTSSNSARSFTLRGAVRPRRFFRIDIIHTPLHVLGAFAPHQEGSVARKSAAINHLCSVKFIRVSSAPASLA